MSRAVVVLAGVAVIGCAQVADVEPSGSGGSGGSAVDSSTVGGGGSWATGGAPSGGSAGASVGGSAGTGPTQPQFLHDGRTYDQELDYIAWDGQVSIVTLKHKDGTALPPSEGGTSCGAGCDEAVTRIEDGASIWGRFTSLATINIQLATTGEAGAGAAIFQACNTQVGKYDLYYSGGGLPGFNNLPSPAWNVPTSGECEWRVTASGGFVYFRAVTVASL